MENCTEHIFSKAALRNCRLKMHTTATCQTILKQSCNAKTFLNKDNLLSNILLSLIQTLNKPEEIFIRKLSFYFSFR